MKTRGDCGVAIANLELKPLRLEDAVEMATVYVRGEKRILSLRRLLRECVANLNRCLL